MKSNFKITCLVTLLVVGLGCENPDMNGEVKVEGARISKIEIDDDAACNPKPGFVVVCENGVANYEVLYTINNGTTSPITLTQPQVNDKSGGATQTNSCPEAPNKSYTIKSGSSLTFTDSLCFPNSYTFNPDNDSIIFSIPLQGSTTPMLITLPTTF